MDHAARGAAALAASDPATAVSEYTQALIQHPTSPDYFIQRSTAFTRLKPQRSELALKDAEYAVLLGQKRAKREKIQAAQQRRVVSLHALGRYADAKFLLQTMERWRPKDSKKDKMEGDMWMARIEQKLKGVPEEQQTITVKEYPDLELPDERRLKETLKSQLKSDGSYKFEDSEEVAVSGLDHKPSTDSTQTTESQPAISDASRPAPLSGTTTLSTPATAAPVVSKIRHEWYQNTQSVIVTIYAKGVPKDKTEVDIQEGSVFISFPHPSNPSSTFTYTLDPLFALINPQNSKWSVMSTKVELTLHKATAGQKWTSLEGTTPLKSPTVGSHDTAKAAVTSTTSHQPEPAKSTATAPSYPTSSRTGPKNWDKLASDLTAKPKKKAKEKETKEETDTKSGSLEHGTDDEDDGVDSDYDTGDAVDSFFKKLYANADPDTRRAMMKSFQESNGTALSTNWAEVGSKHVEPVKSKDEQ